MTTKHAAAAAFMAAGRAAAIARAAGPIFPAAFVETHRARIEASQAIVTAGRARTIGGTRVRDDETNGLRAALEG